MSEIQLKDKIIVALDTHEVTQYDRYLNELKNCATYIKIGMEAFYSMGNDTITKAKDVGLKVFLDLKLHDIPNTVHKSCRALGKLDIDMLNVHAAGGAEMMRAALEGFKEFSQGHLIAVTQLTSTNDTQLKNELLIHKSMEDTVLSYAKNAKNSRLDGVVCSPLEIKLIKENIEKFITVTPGIRPSGASTNDQSRILTPKGAVSLGTDYFVIGRPITQSNNISKAYQDIFEEIK